MRFPSTTLLPVQPQTANMSLKKKPIEPLVLACLSSPLTVQGIVVTVNGGMLPSWAAPSLPAELLPLTNYRRMLVTLVVSKAAFLYSRLMKSYCAIITLSFFRKGLIA